MLNLALAVIQEHAPAAQEHGSGPLTVEGGLMFWTIVVFLLLLAILKRFAWPAILGAVEAREQALERQLAEAARDREAVDISLAAASRLIEKRLDGETDRKLVLEYLSTLESR